jgi:diguanylate cyclase (GGDEF)-like protein
MKNAQAQAVPADLQKVGLYMAKLRVPGLPRNYQLFHEALFGKDRSIGAEIAALGPNPSQVLLDEIGVKYHMTSHCGVPVENSQADAVRMLREVAEKLGEGLKKKQLFARTVEAVTRSVANDPEHSLAVFNAEMDFLSASLESLVVYETELAEMLKADMEKLESIEKCASATRTAATTDRITGLPNHVAFGSRVTALYENDDAPNTALVLVDIDDFRSFNAKYGPQVSSQILKKLGTLFRKTIKKDDFVARLGSDDFALLFSGIDADIARTIAGRLRTSVEETMVFANADKTEHARLTVSLGIALSNEATSPAELVAHAQTALVAAQANRRHPLQVFSRAGR